MIGMKERAPVKNLSLVSLLILVMVGLTYAIAQYGKSKTLSSVPTFTYCTTSGAIWQVDVEGRKVQLVPDTDVQKWKLSWSPDHRLLAYVTFEHLSESETGGRLMVRNADGTSPRTLIGPVRLIEYTWIDSSTVDVLLADQIADPGQRQQWKERLEIDVKSGVQRPAPIHGVEALPRAGSIRLSPDGAWAYSLEKHDGKNYLYLLDSEGGKVTLIHEGPASESLSARWSPDSTYVFYWDYGVGDIHLFSLESGESHQVTHFTDQFDSFTIVIPEWSPTGEWIYFRLETDTFWDHPCIIHVPDGILNCFAISLKTGDLVWSTDGQYLAFIAPAGSAPVDLFVIDAREGSLSNLTQDGDSNFEDAIVMTQTYR